MDDKTAEEPAAVPGEAALFAEPALADWLRPEEDVAWAHVQLSDVQRAGLERRLADGIARPDAVTPWESIKSRALGRARS